MVCGISRKILDGLKTLHRDAHACVKMKGKVGELQYK